MVVECTGEMVRSYFDTNLRLAPGQSERMADLILDETIDQLLVAVVKEVHSRLRVGVSSSESLPGCS